YQLSQLDTHTITSDKSTYNLFTTTLQDLQQHQTLGKKTLQEQAKSITNWLSGKFVTLLKDHNLEASESKITPAILTELLELLETNTISSTAAKDVFEEAFNTGKNPKTIVDEKGLAQVSDTNELSAVIEEVLKENPDVVASIKNGKASAIGFLVGKAMQKSKGKANPKILNDLIAKSINS
ncbi:MAG: Asp-tRNA(Asn)/Glu-tRNA(Gln) amidotransferase GatCAB subunit B, partial [bacterium]